MYIIISFIPAEQHLLLRSYISPQYKASSHIKDDSTTSGAGVVCYVNPHTLVVFLIKSLIPLNYIIWKATATLTAFEKSKNKSSIVI